MLKFPLCKSNNWSISSINLLLRSSIYIQFAEAQEKKTTSVAEQKLLRLPAGAGGPRNSSGGAEDGCHAAADASDIVSTANPGEVMKPGAMYKDGKVKNSHQPLAHWEPSILSWCK